MEWTPITLTGEKPEPLGPHDERRMNFGVPINAAPPHEWIDYLVRLYKEHGNYGWTRYPLPRVEGNHIVIAPLMGELKDWVRGLEARIADANRYYENVVLLGQRKQEERRRWEQETRQRRMEEARREAEEL